MYILGFDIETTGLNPQVNKVLELGAVVWDTGKQAPVAIFDEILNDCIVTPDIESITGIDQKMVNQFGKPCREVYEGFLDLFMRTDPTTLVAHNGTDFDLPFLKYHLELNGYIFDYNRSFVDTRYDLPFPHNVRSRKLGEIAKALQVPVVGAHRAVFDVIMMLQILGKFDIDEVVGHSESRFINLVTTHFVDPTITREFGFYKGKRKGRESLFEMEKKALPFEVRMEEI